MGAEDGCRLFRQCWLPDGEATAVVAIVHGYGEHSGRYDDVVDKLLPLGFAMHGYDLRGHGRSGGVRGHVDRFARYLSDTRAYLQAVAAEHPEAPLFLLGHSFGGLIAALFAEEARGGPGAPGGAAADAARDRGEGRDVVAPAGIVLSAPFLALGTPVSGAKLAGARLLARLVPQRDVGNTLSPADLSHDAAVVAAYQSDPLNHHAATARWAVETLAAQRRALEAAPRLRLPLLVMWGEADRIAAPGASRAFGERAGSADKTLLAYPGLYHEIFHELGKEGPLADLAAWLRARRAGRGPAQA